MLWSKKCPCLCVHIDLMRFHKPPFFVDIHLKGVFLRNNVKGFTKTDIYISVFVPKPSSLIPSTMENQFKTIQVLVNISARYYKTAG